MFYYLSSSYANFLICYIIDPEYCKKNLITNICQLPKVYYNELPGFCNVVICFDLLARSTFSENSLHYYYGHSNLRFSFWPRLFLSCINVWFLHLFHLDVFNIWITSLFFSNFLTSLYFLLLKLVFIFLNDFLLFLMWT